MNNRRETSEGGGDKLAIQFKQKCRRCNKNYVLAGRGQRFVVCYECQKKDLEGELTDPEMKKLFDIPDQLYIDNAFLRDIKVKYLRYNNLTDKQIAAFKKVVEEVKSK